MILRSCGVGTKSRPPKPRLKPGLRQPHRFGAAAAGCGQASPALRPGSPGRRGPRTHRATGLGARPKRRAWPAVRSSALVAQVLTWAAHRAWRSVRTGPSLPGGLGGSPIEPAPTKGGTTALQTPSTPPWVGGVAALEMPPCPSSGGRSALQSASSSPPRGGRRSAERAGQPKQGRAPLCRAGGAASGGRGHRSAKRGGGLGRAGAPLREAGGRPREGGRPRCRGRTALVEGGRGVLQRGWRGPHSREGRSGVSFAIGTHLARNLRGAYRARGRWPRPSRRLPSRRRNRRRRSCRNI